MSDDWNTPDYLDRLEMAVAFKIHDPMAASISGLAEQYGVHVEDIERVLQAREAEA